MKAKNFLSLALLALSGMTGSSAWAHDGDHAYTNGICTIDGCTDQYEAPKQVDGWYEIYNVGNIEWVSNIIEKNQKGADGKAYSQSNYKLMNDLDFEGIKHARIGRSASYKFDGEFDGQRHRIIPQFGIRIRKGRAA